MHEYHCSTYKLTCGAAERAYSHSKQQVHVTEVVSMKGCRHHHRVSTNGSHKGAPWDPLKVLTYRAETCLKASSTSRLRKEKWERERITNLASPKMLRGLSSLFIGYSSVILKFTDC